MIPMKYILTLACVLVSVTSAEDSQHETEVKDFLQTYDSESRVVFQKYQEAKWQIKTNNSIENEGMLLKTQMSVANFSRTMRDQTKYFRLSTLSDDTQRQLSKIKNIGVLAERNISKVQKLFKIKNRMEAMYSKAKFCVNRNKCFPLSPDGIEVIENYNARLNFWINWRNITGGQMKKVFKNYVKLSNDAVNASGFKDLSAHMIHEYDINLLVAKAYHIMKNVRPLYRQLHAYVRKILKQEHGAKMFPLSGHIPAHLLGNMWADRWNSLLYLVEPFPNRTELEFQLQLTEQNYTTRKIIQMAENFTISLGLDKIYPSFWKLSSLEPPKGGRNVTCQTTLMEFPKETDMRLIMCNSDPKTDYVTIHKEVGRMAYYTTASDQPFIFRGDANAAFHEAVGGVFALSAQTPEHLKKRNLIETAPTDEETNINYLMNIALSEVANLPFAYIVDSWRWSVLSGTTLLKDYNKYWWRLRCEFQGVSPPVKGGKKGFDPGSTYDIAAGLQAMRRFLGTILQFQFYKAACQAANHQGPFHRCDIYGSTEAGEKLRSMMKLGSSKPWWKLLDTLTGQTKITARPMLEYFKPLMDFLKKKNGNVVGWKSVCEV